MIHVAVGVLAGVTGGPAAYGRKLVNALGETGRVRLTVITDRPTDFQGMACDVVMLPMRGGIDRLRWQYLALPRALKHLSCDIYHDSKNALPSRPRIPMVVAVHDLAYYSIPETFGGLSRLFLRRATSHAVKRAARVIVCSDSTARDVARYFPKAVAKTRMVFHGIDPATPVSSEQREAVRAKYELRDPFVLHVGTLQVRKNVDLLIAAVRRLRAEGLPYRCVVVGRRGWMADNTIAEIERDDTALWLGEVPGEDLPALYALADAFGSPSAYEGFGFTVADALAAGVPTVVADKSSLPEVVGDAAVRVAEFTEGAWAAALRTVLEDEELATRLRAAGPRRAAELSWQRTADRTLQVYGEIAAL